MTSQCTWFVLEKFGTDKQAADQAEREATLTLVEGCSQGEYQMVLLRGTPLADRVIARLQSRGRHDDAAVRAECAAEARKIKVR
jgi:ethanolamine ammonia-lyase large subunit